MFPKYPERGSAMTSEHAGGTRERILVLLRRHGSLSAPRLAELLQLTSVGVRRHLALLERDGLVASTTEKPRRGRPTAVYRLTDAGLERFPRHYDEVAREALAFLKDRDAAALSQFLAWRNERLAANYAGLVDGAVRCVTRIDTATRGKRPQHRTTTTPSPNRKATRSSA